MTLDRKTLQAVFDRIASMPPTIHDRRAIMQMLQSLLASTPAASPRVHQPSCDLADWDGRSNDPKPSCTCKPASPAPTPGVETETLEAAREFVTLANTIWENSSDGQCAKELAEVRMGELARIIMAAQGRAVERPKLQPGDWVMFTTGAIWEVTEESLQPGRGVHRFEAHAPFTIKEIRQAGGGRWVKGNIPGRSPSTTT